MPLHVLGVRHHSPACARLVARSIRELRPRFVLIEGPADLNHRIDELLLGHELPVAIFTYYQHEDRTHASWTPFCRHSPEWIALIEGRAIGAEVRFMDLPAWHSAFAGVRNRYHDRPQRGYVERLCEKLRVDNVDALWDHLFEQPLASNELAARLDEYFVAVRGEAPGDERDAPREDFMRRCIGWALAQGGDVLVVCGGFHAPALASTQPSTEPDFPAVEAAPEGARQGSYLVPYSFKRLDSFVGYESGLPSPAYYDAVWELGPERAAETMLRRAAERLRDRKQLVSPADLIAYSTMTAALARVRGHVAPARIDVLDGVAGALVKDALEVPLPWSYRGTILPRTDPVLVEVMAALSGEAVGSLAEGTPRPPLLFDVAAILDALDLHPRGGRPLRLDLADERDRRRSRVLHQLRVLAIPGFVRAAGPEWATDAVLTEQWELSRPFEQESTLIEASAWGATLESAAAARIEQQLLAAGGKLPELAQLLGEAVFIGVTTLAMRVLAQVATAVHEEPSLGALGLATKQLLALWRHDVLLGARDTAQLGVILQAAFDRGLWLVEGIQGAAAPTDESHLVAMIALRDLVRHGETKLGLGRGRVEALMARRAADPTAPPSLRGAAVGFAWSLGVSDQAAATTALRHVARPRTLGDFLAGLLALAREEVLVSDALVAAIDVAVREIGRDEFLIGLPSLRLAFSYLPPLEREALARRIVTLHGADPTRTRDLLRLQISPDDLARGLRLDEEVTHLMAEYGLT
jgi:Family of unknown function (DUF5682)